MKAEIENPEANPIPTTGTALIFGCGFLGRHLADRLLAAGVTVYGTTRSTGHAEQLAEAGIRPLLLEVTSSLTLAALNPALEAEELDVYYLIPPGRAGREPTPRQVVIDGANNVINALGDARIRQAVMVSSTAVYGQSGGQRVDADTPPEPVDDRGKLLLEGENVWLDSDLPARVLRLAGLYGPHRTISLDAVRDGSPIVGDPNVLLNLIHVDDAADLLLAVAGSTDAAKVELGCDGSPVKRIEYYQYLAHRLGVPVPQVLDDQSAAEQLGLNVQRLRRLSSKACDPIATCARTGWRPRYESFREGLDDILGPAPDTMQVQD